ncbi:hypothetical protein RKD49_005034 [Streptomyces glaucescens]
MTAVLGEVVEQFMCRFADRLEILLAGYEISLGPVTALVTGVLIELHLCGAVLCCLALELLPLVPRHARILPRLSVYAVGCLVRSAAR